MGDLKEIRELEENILRAEEKYRECVQAEQELLANIPQHGFAAVPARLRLVDEMRTLSEMIRRGKMILRWKNQMN
jgi:hypothetical protein